MAKNQQPQRNGILFPKLFWPTVRKKSQNVCKFLAFSLEFQKFFPINIIFFLKVGQNNFGNKIPFLFSFHFTVNSRRKKNWRKKKDKLHFVVVIFKFVKLFLKNLQKYKPGLNSISQMMPIVVINFFTTQFAYKKRNFFL